MMRLINTHKGFTSLKDFSSLKRLPLVRGFTLLEVMVVILIIALVSGLSMLGLKQASDRRYFSQADNLLVWLQQISELAMLEGNPYGLIRQEQTLHTLVFYRQRWHQAANPEPFQLYLDGLITLPENDDVSLFRQEQDAPSQLLPDLVMLPNGYMEPALGLNLSYANQLPSFDYYWDVDAFSLAMKNAETGSGGG